MFPQQTVQKTPVDFVAIKQWLHRHPAAMYGLSAAGLVIVGGLVAFALGWQKPESVVPKKTAPAPAAVTAPVFYSALTGEQVADRSSVTKPVTAIMIENSPDARPQSGLKDAEVVYEAIAEGGITRFLALYQQHAPALVGPVRSLRPYYLSWATPYDASIAHVGGSAQALQSVRNGSYRDIDQFFNPGSYWRATDRSAPHNVYTSFERINALNAAKKYTNSNPIGFARGTSPKSMTPARTISVNISSPLYNSSYAYDDASGQYLRTQAGAPHNDREAGQISAKTVIALSVPMNRVMEDGYRESIGTEGTGSATVFVNGTVSAVNWRKDTTASQIKFTNPDGSEYALERGTTWVVAVANDKPRVSWQ